MNMLYNKAATFGPSTTHKEEKSQKIATLVSAMKSTRLLVFLILLKKVW